MDNRPKTPREHELMAERNYYRRALEEIAGMGSRLIRHPHHGAA